MPNKPVLLQLRQRRLAKQGESFAVFTTECRIWNIDQRQNGFGIVLEIPFDTFQSEFQAIQVSGNIRVYVSKKSLQKYVNRYRVR